MTSEALYVRRVEPLALGWRSHAWSTGVFDTAQRSYTPNVEGTIRTPRHLVLVTLRGQAERLEVSTSCGHRYTGLDRAGAVSFVPAHAERQLRLQGVAAEWGSMSLSPSLFDPDADADQGVGGSLAVSAFTNVEDLFVLGMVTEFARLTATDGALDPTYCDAMSWALARYLVTRYGEVRNRPRIATWRLAPWRIRRVADYVDAHLAEPMRIAELAELVGVSPGYFHRAFRETVGKTPLDFINCRRVQRAMQLLQRDDAPMAAIARRVGFVSPSHFTRTFRQVTGINPSRYRDGTERPVIISPPD